MTTTTQFYSRGASLSALFFVLAISVATFARAEGSESVPGVIGGSQSVQSDPRDADNKQGDPGDFLSRYRVATGDVISIRVFGEDDLNRERIRLTDTGTVVYPVLGEVKVSGMRPVEIERAIADGLRKGYLKNPKVSVTVDEYRPYFITGEVGKAGSFPYVPGMTVLKAITIAGGFKERASRSKIFIAKEDNPKDRRKVDLATPIEPGDILTIEESFF